MIVCAAIKITMNNMAETSEVICGLRHGDCLKTIRQLNSNWLHCKQTQGFINHKGEFLDRKEALTHALECGQLNETTKWYQKDHGIDELYSEDLC
jgi:hypothetical protein